MTIKTVTYQLTHTAGGGFDTAVMTVDIVPSSEFIVQVSPGASPTATTAAINAALNTASTNAPPGGYGVVELLPSTTYVVNGTSGTGGGTGNPNGCIQFLGAAQSNVWLRTAGQPTGATRAVIQLASTASFLTQLAVIIVKHATAQNIKITHVTVDGNKFGLDRAVINAGQPANNTGMSCIHFDGGKNIYMQWVEAKNGFVDGLCMKRCNNDASITETVLCEDCDFHHNRRQGMSIIDCGTMAQTWDQIVFTRVKFRDTGDDVGYVGQAPGAGVDVEPNGQNDITWGISFYDCEWTNNGPYSEIEGNDIATTTARQLVFDMGAFTNDGMGTDRARYFKVSGGIVNRGSPAQGNADAFAFILRQSDAASGKLTVLDQVQVTGVNVAAGTYIYIEGFQNLTTDKSRMTNTVFSNNVVNEIYIQNISITGNSVSGSGNTKPAGGATTVTVIGGITGINIVP